jgi:hypothetical protein
MGLALQILLALIIVIILYIVTIAILGLDSIVVSKNTNVFPQESTMIVNGYAPASYLIGRRYNTINMFSSNFMKIGRSVNTQGGAQFTYQFWIRIDDPNDKFFKDLVLLLKGDDRKYKMGVYDKDKLTLIKRIPEKQPGSMEDQADIMIRCPLIKFVDSYRRMRVQFNTANNPLTTIDINMDPNKGIDRRNILSLLPLNWYLMTFVFQDNVSYTNMKENGINFQFWLNDIAYQENGANNMTGLKNNMLKQNDGDLFLFPTMNDMSSGAFMRIGNIAYYNYALPVDEIRRTYRAGPPTTSALEQKKDNPAYLSAFNKIDVYNY